MSRWRALAASVAMTPAVAFACPACAARSDWQHGPALLALAALVAAPFAVAVGAYRLIRWLDRGP